MACPLETAGLPFWFLFWGMHPPKLPPPLGPKNLPYLHSEQQLSGVPGMTISHLLLPWGSATEGCNGGCRP